MESRFRKSKYRLKHNSENGGKSMKSAWLLARASGEYAHDRRIYQLVKMQQCCKNQGLELAGVTELSSEMPIDFHLVHLDLMNSLNFL